jgi:hypothetical protein
MKKLPDGQLVDLHAEVDAMAVYVAKRWANVPDLKALFTRIADEVTQFHRFWFNDTRLSMWCFDRLKEREKQLEDALGKEACGPLTFFDMPQVILRGVAMMSSTLFREVTQLNEDSSDFERRVNKLVTGAGTSQAAWLACAFQELHRFRRHGRVLRRTARDG